MSQCGKTTEHFFFGTPNRLLYGVYHHSAQKRTCPGAVLLCYPFGHEYIRSHRTYRQLAIKLSGAGFDVLRFDYYGCGDSGGNFEQARLSHWIEDIALALKQVMLRGKPKDLIIGGLRLGGTLAAIASADRTDVDGLILWEPVIDGTNYLSELIKEQSRFVDSRHPEFKSLYSNKKVPDEIIGYPLTSGMVQDFTGIDLMAASQSNVGNILILLNESKKSSERYFEKWAEEGKRQTTLKVVAEQKLWLESPYKALVPVRSLEYIVGWAASKAK